MFTWYHGSSLTIVYLHGIFSESQHPDDLQRCIWNTCAWIYQEYVAAKNIQFYTEDWKPYLHLDMFNHKNLPAVVSEMKLALGISAQELAVLCPSLNRVHQKLYLASRQQTMLVEDIAYSLYGIFDVSIPIIYGEDCCTIGRLLEHVLMGSGDVTILAWTGHAGRYNSCLPIDLAVYNQITPPQILRLIETLEIDRTVKELHSSAPDLSLALTLYNQLHDLPSRPLAASRLHLPGIVFPLPELECLPDPGSTTHHVYRGMTPTLGDVEIKTTHDLSRMNGFCLVHPWIRPSFDQEFLNGAIALDKMTQALQLVAHLRQPFGTLLFSTVSWVEYKHVAVDSLIMVKVRKEVPWTNLMDNIQTIEVL